MVNKPKSQTKKITNKRARFDYDLGSEFVAGLSLTGAETKSLRMGHGHLKGSYVTAKDNELWLFNATINGTNGIPLDESQQTRTRKLLMKRREIDQLLALRQQGQSIIPLELLIGGRYIKLRLGTGRGRKKHDKREVLKKRDQERANRIELKNR